MKAEGIRKEARINCPSMGIAMLLALFPGFFIYIFLITNICILRFQHLYIFAVHVNYAIFAKRSYQSDYPIK